MDTDLCNLSSSTLDVGDDSNDGDVKIDPDFDVGDQNGLWDK
jgi:hypothetical protein